MRKYQQHPSTSRQETLRLIMEYSQFQPRVEVVPVREALGRVTARDIQAENTLPNSPSSTMDGIAVKSANLNNIADISQWQEGIDYVFSNTGVGIPDEFDTVVLIENVEFDEAGRLRNLLNPQPGQNVRPVGTIMQTGEILVPAHYLLRPAQLGLLIAGGITEVAVLAKPRVAILPTGNELVPAGCTPPRGKNVESNGTMIEAYVKMMGGEPRLFPITRDDPDELFKIINAALDWADIVILNGGTSKGSDDRAIEVQETIGKILVYEVDYGPGKHTTMTVAGSKLIVGTVGPTIGAVYAVEWYVSPLINKYLSQPTAEPQRLKVTLAEEIVLPAPIDVYARMQVRRTGEAYEAIRVNPAGPLAKQMMANAYMLIPGEVQRYKAGEVVEVTLRCPLEYIEKCY